MADMIPYIDAHFVFSGESVSKCVGTKITYIDKRVWYVRQQPGFTNTENVYAVSSQKVREKR